MEPPPGFGAEEQPDDQRRDDRVLDEFPDVAERAQHDVKNDPRGREPTRPVPAKEEEDSGDSGKHFGELDPDALRRCGEQIVEVCDETDDADGEVRAGDDENRNWCR